MAIIFANLHHLNDARQILCLYSVLQLIDFDCANDVLFHPSDNLGT